VDSLSRGAGRRAAGGRASDIFRLGSVLYEMATGEHAVRGQSSMSMPAQAMPGTNTGTAAPWFGNAVFLRKRRDTLRVVSQSGDRTRTQENSPRSDRIVLTEPEVSATRSVPYRVPMPQGVTNGTRRSAACYRSKRATTRTCARKLMGKRENGRGSAAIMIGARQSAECVVVAAD
jgi:hypothetical protein